MKKCAKCKNEYPLENFPKDKTHKCGHRSYCFTCNRKKINEVAFKRKLKRHQYNKENKNLVKEYNQDYYAKNKKMFQNNYKKYLQTNPQFKIIHNTRIRINKALKNNSKNSSTINLLGCTLDFYKQYLEQQFKPDMSWENYGKLWDIDHIKSCASFDLSLEEEQKRCFHYTNTQPLYKLDNQRKNKY
jgi:hypothetical protein